MEFYGSQTEKNLKKTFTGESKANTKYTLYAEKARSEGLHYVAQVFDETAFNELAHARRVFGEFLGEVNSTEENLMNAFMGETAEATVDIYMKVTLHLKYVLFVNSLKDGLSHIVTL